MLPVKYQKPFLQYVSVLKKHPFAATYRDAGRVKLFDKIFSRRSLQLYQQEAQASIHTPSKVPLCVMNVNLKRVSTLHGTMDNQILTKIDV